MGGSNKGADVGDSRPRHRGRSIAVAAGTVVLAAGAGWWVLRGGEDPAVAVPSRVCDGSISGGLASPVLPKRGTAYTEETRAFDKPGGSSGYCFLRAGGISVEIKYDLSAGGTFSEENIEEQAALKGRSSLASGTAKGYVSDRGGALFVPCPTQGDRDSLAWVTVGYVHADDDLNGSQQPGFRDLTIAAARYAAQDLLACERA